MFTTLTSVFATLVSLSCSQTYNGKSEAWSNITLRSSNSVWTQFQYIVADNNLDSFSVSDLNEMRTNNASADDWNVVIYVDRCFGCDYGNTQDPIEEIYDCDTDTAVSGTFNGTKLLQKDGNRWCQIYSFTHELDSMNPDNIEEFVSMMSAFESTSTHFMLTLWDHGGAWSGFGDDKNTGGSNETVNNLDGLFSAVATGLQDTHLGRLDILGFDACIMADYSVLHYLNKYDVTKYYIASEVSEPGDGWDYTGIDPSQHDPIDFGMALIDGFVNQGNVMMDGAGAGYTLALFDMDKVSAFLSQFDALIIMATAAIEGHDYGMLMAMLRGQAVATEIDDYFHLYDLGLFLEGLTAESNIFWNTCDDRIMLAGENARDYLEESILYFEADFVRQDMTGSTIYYTTSEGDMNQFYGYNDDMKSSNYLTFLKAMNETLDAVLLDTVEWTTDYCTASAPSNFTFAIHGNEVAYSEEYGVYKLTTEVTATVMGATSALKLEIPLGENSTYTMWMGVAELATKIVDEDFDNAQLVTYWDGRVALFQNTISNSSELWNTLGLSNDKCYASGEISFVSYDEDTNIPLGYVVKYPVYVYDDVDDVPEDIDNAPNDTNVGYLQFEVVFKSGEDGSEYIDIGDVTLYEIDVYQGVIAEVSHDSMRIITPLADIELEGGNDTNTTTDTTADSLMGMMTTDFIFPSMMSSTDIMMSTEMETTEEEETTTTSTGGGGDSGSSQVMGVLVWPNFTIEHKLASAMLNDSEVLVLELEAEDVFGNVASTMFDVANATAWNVTVPETTDVPVTTEEMTTTEPEMTTTDHEIIVTDVETTDDNEGKSSEKLQHGLDDVPGFVWLILLSALFVMVFVFCAMWWRSRKQFEELVASGDVGKSPYVQMDDKDDPML